MYQGEIQPVPQSCTACGAGPWHPQTEQYHDRTRDALITEATWRCGRCGHLFARGEISATPITKATK